MTVLEPASSLEILAMSQQDLPAALELSRAVGWPHRLEDWQFVLALGEGLVARSGAQMVGTAMAWTFGGQARVGMVIVDPNQQRAGIGRRLMSGILEQVVAPSLALTATEAGEPLYRRLGFETVGTVIQHHGLCNSAPLIPLRSGERIRPVGRSDLQSLVALDALATGVSRAPLIAALVRDGEAVALDDNGETVGFAFCRRFGRGHVVGPVIARDSTAAKALIAHWIGSHAGAFLRVDVTGRSGLTDWLTDVGLPGFSPVRTMVRGGDVARDALYQSFAVANQALG